LVWVGASDGQSVSQRCGTMHLFGHVSRLLHRHVIRVSRERSEIAWIRTEYGSAGLGERDQHSIDGRASTRPPAKKGSPPRENLRDLLHDIASLQKAVRKRIATRMPLQALHENN
jgi:hypothetical protein